MRSACPARDADAHGTATASAPPRGRVRPDASGWRARLSLFLPVLALASATPGLASAAVLVGNIGQSVGIVWQLSNVDVAQGFTTGSNAGGYTLTSIELDFDPAVEAASGVTARVATGLPSGTTTFVTLTNPSSIGSGNTTFTAPAGTTLSADTTYWVVVEATGGAVSATRSNAEDTGGQAGWTVNDSNLTRIADSTGSWTSLAGPVMIRVNGSAVPAKPARPTRLRATAGNAKVDLSWRNPSDSSITGYQYRQKAGSAAWGAWTNIPSSAPGGTNATSYSVTSLTNGTAYRFRIRAVNAGGESQQSAVAGPVTPRAASTSTPGRGIWSATLKVSYASAIEGNPASGCENGAGAGPALNDCSSTTVLTDDDFDWPTMGGTTYTILRLYISHARLYMGFSGVAPAAAKTALTGLSLTVGSGMTARTFAIADASVSPTHSALVWGSNVPSWSNDDTVALSLIAPAPTNSAATGKPTITGTARVGQTLTAAKGSIEDTNGVTKADAGNTAFAYIYQWIRVDSDGSNPVNIPGATSGTYTLASADLGKRVRVKVGFKDDAGNFESRTSDAYPAMGTVAAAAPADNTAPTVTSGSTGYYSDAAATMTLTGPLKAGATIYTKVTFSEDMKHVKGDGTDARPELFHRIGSTDTRYDILDNGETLASGDCQPIHSSNTNVYVCLYTVGGSDDGAFTVKAGTSSVDKADNALAADYVHSATLALDTTAPAAPASLAAEAGDGKVTLTWGNPSSADATIDKWQYRYKSAGEYGSWTDVSGGASKRTVEVGSLSNGTAYTFQVRAVDTAANEGAASTAGPVTPVATNSAATGKPTITGTATVGQTLTAAKGAIADTDGVTKATAGDTGFAWTYQWIRVDSDGTSNTVNIPGATSSTYALKAADQGKRVRVKVGFKDDAGNAESRTSDAYPESGTVAAAASTSTPRSGTAFWTATLTVGYDSSGPGGYCNGAGTSYCDYGSLSDDDFTLDGTNYTVESVRWGNASNDSIHLTLDKDFPDASLSEVTLQIGSHSFVLSNASRSTSGAAIGNNYRWTTPSGWSDPAEDAVVTVRLLGKDSVPAKPTGLTATPGDTQVTLAWTDPRNTTITKHQYRQKAGANAYGSWTNIPSSAPGGSNATSYTVTSLKNGTAYRFRIRAVNAHGNSAESDEAGPAIPAKSTARVSAFAITSNPPSNQGGQYKAGDRIVVTATFNEAIAVTGAPALRIRVGTGADSEKIAACAKRGTTGEDAKALVCTYTVAVGDEDTNGIAIEAGKLTGTIRDASSNPAALRYTAIADSASHKVDGVRPKVIAGLTGFFGDESATAALTKYRSGADIYTKVTFSEDMKHVKGDTSATARPQILFTRGSQGNYYDILGPDATLASEDCKPVHATKTDVYICRYTAARSEGRVFSLQVSNVSADKAGNALSSSYFQRGSLSRDTSAAPKLSLVLGAANIAESGAGNATTVKATLPGAASAAVTVTLGSSPAGKVAFGTATVTIPSGGTESPTTTVTAVDNKVDAADATVTVSGTTASTAVTAPDGVTLTVTDDDTKGVTLSRTTVPVNEGGTATYTARLDSEPTASVVVTPTSGDTGAVTVSTAATDNTLTFTTSNWQTAQTVTVAGVQDADNADESVTVTHAASGAGSGYGSVSVADVTVSVDDDEPADATRPTVLSASTGYFSDAGAANALTGPQKSGAEIYTKVTFSEDMKHVKADDATARPELFRRIGSTDTQYDILDSGDTLASGDCQPNHGTNTNVYVCLYTVGGSDNGAFTVKAGTGSEDKAGNALASAYTHDTTLALDTAAPAAPASLAAEAGDGKVTLTWGDPSPADASIDKWQYRYKSAGEYGSWTDVSGGASKRTVEVGSLSNGTAYTFQVRAVDTAANAGAASTAGPVTPAAADATAPTVAAASTGYFSDAAATMTLTGPQKSGAAIYTKVTFSEDMKHVKADDATARPELFRRIGSTDTQYDILDSGDTLASGDCKPNHGTNTNVYVCLYTVGGSDNGAFAVKAGTSSVDRAGNALAADYVHSDTIALDNTAPTVLSASTGYYGDAAATMTLTGPRKSGAAIYTKVTFSEDMRHVKADGTTARPALFHRIGSTDTQYDILDSGDTL
ncbi:MAG: hypothetical protein F4213_08100, partial [Boseongicola sp. SB0677_bin_26]|nr:hypothetical protein [Boseongicola sp. SB0677_bin_26]